MTKREEAEQKIMDLLRVRDEGPMLRDEIKEGISTSSFSCSDSTVGQALIQLREKGKIVRHKAGRGTFSYSLPNGLTPPTPLNEPAAKPERVFKSIDEEIAHAIRENEKLDEQLRVLRDIQKKKMEDSIENAKKKQELRDLLKAQKSKKAEIAQLLQTNQDLTKSA